MDCHLMQFKTQMMLLPSFWVLSPSWWLWTNRIVLEQTRFVFCVFKQPWKIAISLIWIVHVHHSVPVVAWCFPPTSLGSCCFQRWKCLWSNQSTIGGKWCFLSTDLTSSFATELTSSICNHWHHVFCEMQDGSINLSKSSFKLFVEAVVFLCSAAFVACCRCFVWDSKCMFCHLESITSSEA